MDRLTRILKREIGKQLEIVLITLNYQYIVVRIRRIVVGEVFRRGYQDKVGEVEEAKVDEDSKSILELQSAWTTKIGVGNYSVLVDIIKYLSI